MVLLNPQIKIIKSDELREQLAALEHDQWILWAKDILKSEPISEDRAKRWEQLFVPYAELSEEDKDKDREWADKVIALIQEQKSLDGSTNNGAEWIPTKLLRPKKKKGTISKPWNQ